MRKTIDGRIGLPAILAGLGLAMAMPALAQTSPDAVAPATPPEAVAPTTPPAASGASQLAAGATVYDQAGNAIATIASVEADKVVVTTANGPLSIPAASFGNGTRGPVLSTTKAELDTAAQQPGA